MKNTRPTVILDSRSDVPIVFDGAPGDVAIAFYPRRPPAASPGRWLWWTRPVTPRAIDEVIKSLRRQRLPVAIVIGGLDRYLMELGQWPPWLANWARSGGPTEIVVDTGQLDPKGRQRLIDATHRQLQMLAPRDPVTTAVAGVGRWILGRMR